MSGVCSPYYLFGCKSSAGWRLVAVCDQLRSQSLRRDVRNHPFFAHRNCKRACSRTASSDVAANLCKRVLQLADAADAGVNRVCVLFPPRACYVPRCLLSPHPPHSPLQCGLGDHHQPCTCKQHAIRRSAVRWREQGEARGFLKEQQQEA